VREPAEGWVPLGPQPRYLSNYVGLRNRFSVLNEQYPYVDFRARVEGAYDLFRSFLDHIHANKDQMVTLAREADRRMIERGTNPSDEQFVLEYGREAIDLLITIRGYEMEILQQEGGRPRVRPTENKRTYSDVPYLARYIPERTTRLPHGYLIGVQDRAVVDKLLHHGVAVERLTEAATLSVEAFSVTEISGSDRLDQGHYTNSVSGEYSIVEREFGAGTYFVTTAQSLGGVAAYLLEPESDDGLVVWNFFDRYLSAQWSTEPQIYPVYKLLEPARLVTVRVGR